jgi:hypothetical protein
MMELFVLLLVGSLDGQTNQTIMANQTNQTDIVDTLAQQELDKLREDVSPKLIDKIEEDCLQKSEMSI